MQLDTDGLIQISITDEPKPRTASITHHPNGEFNITYTGDPLLGMQMMADAAYVILCNDIKPTDKPVLPGVNSKVCIQLTDGKVTMAFGTEADGQTTADSNVAKGLMLAAIMGLCEKTSTGKFNPIEAFSGMLTV